jgi:hypothetical protein
MTNRERIDEAQVKAMEIIGLLNEVDRLDLTMRCIQGVGELHSELDRIRIALQEQKQ